MLKNNKHDWIDKKAIYTATEIAQQPETWVKTRKLIKDNKDEIESFVNSVINEPDYDVIFTGAGTSEFVGNSLEPIFLSHGHEKFKSVPTTDLVVTPQYFVKPNKPTLLVSFGRSGNSPESIGAIDAVNAVNPNTKHLVITCNHEGKLAIREDENILAIKLPEETNDLSFAMTSSFSNMYLAAYLAFNLDLLDDDMQAVIDNANDIIDNVDGQMKQLTEEFDFNRIVYLGDGVFNGVAEESALKMLELTAGDVVTMFNTPLGFRHGPKSIVNNDTLTVIYMSKDDYTRQYQSDIIKEMSGQRKDNKIMVVDQKDDEAIRPLVDYYIVMKNDVGNEDYLGINYVMVAQILAFYKSLQLGKTPDNPWPSGEVNRVVKGVVIYPYEYKQ